jgi:glycosyltransferase involved in cell wall biosynthesis
LKIATTTLGCDGGLSGIGRYASTLLERWTSNNVDLSIHGHNSDRAAFIPSDRKVEWRPVPEYWKKPLPSLLWHQVMLPQLVRKADVLFLPAGNRRLPVAHTVPSVGTVHDCSSFHVHGKYDRAREVYIKQVLPRLMQQLDHVITVSESTRRDIIDLCGVRPQDITVIPLAADTSTFFPRDPAVSRLHLKQRFGIVAPFLLYTSRIEHPGKNHSRLIAAFELLKKQHRIPHQLVLVGPDKERAAEVHRAAALSSAAADIIFTGSVPAADLPHLYSAADALIFPSLYEGFGLPLLEAMACGTVVACSDRSSMPEVAGNCAVLFDPEDPAAIARGILQLLSESPADRASRLQSGIQHVANFSWDRTAASTLNVLHRTAGFAVAPNGKKIAAFAPHSSSRSI